MPLTQEDLMWLLSHGLIEWVWLQKAFKVIESNHSLTLYQGWY